MDSRQVSVSESQSGKAKWEPFPGNPGCDLKKNFFFFNLNLAASAISWLGISCSLEDFFFPLWPVAVFLVVVQEHRGSVAPLASFIGS